MFDSIQLALTSLKKQWKFASVLCLLLMSTSFMFANATASLMDNERAMRDTDFYEIVARRLTYENFEPSFVNYLSKTYTTTGASFYQSESLSSRNNSNIQLVFGAENILRDIKALDYVALGSSAQCLNTPTIMFDTSMDCMSDGYNEMFEVFQGNLLSDNTVFILVPGSETESVISRLNSGESSVLGEVVARSLFREIEDVTQFVSELERMQLFAAVPANVGNHQETRFVLEYVYVYLFITLVCLGLGISIMASSLFNEQLRIYSVHMSYGLSEHKAKVGALLHYYAIGIGSILVLCLIGLLRPDDLPFYGIFYGVYFAVISAVVLWNVKQERVLENMKKDKKL